MLRTKLTIGLTIAAVCFGAALAAPALAQRGKAASPIVTCNPPPRGLTQAQWYQACEGVLRARFIDSNIYQLPYPTFVQMLWQMYDVGSNPSRYPNLVGSPCSPEGSGFMNSSGHAQICRGGRWTVGGS